ncbi:HlyD family secretion protein [Sandaracinus amylolyticus]|uniref:HlyD family secretion protein n=1 Tax=Sandaracinus amylolyticus TaxID=927083 RepID=UPI001F26CFA0|nr:HlyD family efflux transporter periplasmic adaptor subunit [Sandaracinus amylolyticus]UJR84520.1 Hypothetical protein I5071_65990 [Sandaracinus amylolyticus]
MSAAFEIDHWQGRFAAVVVGIGLAVGCSDAAPQALGTLEYDRITLPSPAAERIVAIEVREGERVAPGQLLVQLDAARTGSAVQAAAGEAHQRREVLAELEAGPRREDVARARAELAAAEAEARDARSYLERVESLEQRGVVARVELDRARGAAGSSAGRVRAASAALLELERGTRPEQIAQAEAAVIAASARMAEQVVLLDKLSVVAPRAAEVDSLPYRLGDQAPVGAPLAILLVGDAPYARVYVPEPIRARVHVGQSARVFVDGRDRPLAGRVRMIRSEPSFTPYYALTGDDAARLSYLAEVELTGEDARGLPAGMPVRVELAHEVDGGH